MIEVGDGIIVAIDGPVGAGKSTVAKLIAKGLSIVYVDTGAMYRAVGLYAVRNNVDTKDRERLSKLINEIEIDVKVSNAGQRIFLNKEDVTGLIRTPEMSMAASNVSAIPEVRARLVDMQREIGKNRSIVMDGRDIGTVVFPNANIKIYLTASPEERAGRRYSELINKGQKVTFKEVYEDLMKRDHNDMSRDASPLKPAEDAVILDTTGKDLEKVVKEAIELINATL